MSRHSQKEIERIKRVAAGADFGKTVAQGLLAAPTGSEHWVKSEYPHPKFPSTMRRMQLLPDVIWLRYHGEEVTGWSKNAPNKP